MANSVAILDRELPGDFKGHKLQLPAYLRFQDATATPIVSPKTGVGTTPQAFAVPTGATGMTFRGTAAMRFGDNADLDGSASGKGYKKASGSLDTYYPVIGESIVYIRAETGTVDIDFSFDMIGKKP